MTDRALLRMLDEHNPNWSDQFLTLREAAEYYGLEAMLEYDSMPDDEYAELDFNDD